MAEHEFILVIHARRRPVVVNGVPRGYTNQTIMVPRGAHKVTLGEPTDYRPAFRRAVVRNTTPAAPHFLMFSASGE
jgi:hypothetical protein